MTYGTKIFLGSIDKNLKKRLKKIFKMQGFTLVGEAEDGITSLRMIRRFNPDLVILDKDLPGKTGLELAQIIAEDSIAPVILLTSSFSEDVIEITKETTSVAFLIKPISEGHLLSMISFVLNAFQKMSKLEKKVDELQETIETRKVIEKAKGLLMKTMNLSEEEAFQSIRKQSMDKCISMKQVAEAIILTFDIKYR